MRTVCYRRVDVDNEAVFVPNKAMASRLNLRSCVSELRCVSRACPGLKRSGSRESPVADRRCSVRDSQDYPNPITLLALEGAALYLYIHAVVSILILFPLRKGPPHPLSFEVGVKL